MAGDDMNKEKADIFDHDLTQAVLLNLPQRFQVFTTIFRADPKNDFEEFSEQIILEDRQMQQHQRACLPYTLPGKCNEHATRKMERKREKGKE